MGLASYCSACLDLAEELRSSLESREIEALHSELKGQKVADWIRWRSANESLVFQFVEATPKERLTRVKYKEDRLRLTMAAVQHCLEAHAVLSIASDPSLQPGGSYRAMAAAAGDAYGKLYEYEIPYWSFGNFESPFGDDPYRERPL